MCDLKRVGDLHANLERLLEPDGSSLDPVLQGCAFEALHHDEQPVLMFADIVDSANVGMIERRSSPRFTLKTLAGLRILRQFFRKEFERHPPTKPLIFSLVNHAHPATTQLFRDAVMRNGEPNHVAAMLGLGERQVNFGPEELLVDEKCYTP